MGRLEMLKEHLEEYPNDAFGRYGLAMEYATSGDHEAALTEFATLLKDNPDYTAGYFMAAQILAKVGRTGEAREMLTRGITSAEGTNNAHAKSEMEGMLAELG
jgi:thioredoxin-like negative regulator of GroEL